MTRICKGIRRDLRPDVRELVYVTQSMEASHRREDRPKPHQIEAIYRIDEDIAAPAPTAICIVDDVITAGAHFRAMSNVLKARFPNVPILGLFVARRVVPPVEFDDIS
jgi:predicted amidophosphoribosyltransferase